jgi:hypothetical protein
MGLIGGYDGRLYCDHDECRYYHSHVTYNYEPDYESGDFNSYNEFIRHARKLGWTFSWKHTGFEESGFALCPKHSKKERKKDMNELDSMTPEELLEHWIDCLEYLGERGRIPCEYDGKWAAEFSARALRAIQKILKNKKE